MEEHRKYGTSALVLAAGEGKRLGQPKALAELEATRKSFLVTQLDFLRQFQFSKTYVVLGAKGSKIQSEIDFDSLNVRPLINSNWKAGQYSSIFCGLQKLSPQSNWTMVLPVDVLCVNHKTITHLLASLNDEYEVVAPMFNSRRGHPVFLSSKFCKKCLTKNPYTSRLDHLIQNAKVLNVEVDDEAVLNNVNTPLDLKKLSQEMTNVG